MVLESLEVPKTLQGPIGLSFITTYLYEAILSLHTSIKTTYHNSLNTEVDMKYSYLFLKPDIKEMCKHVKQCHSPKYFYFGKYIFFIKCVYVDV